MKAAAAALLLLVLPWLALAHPVPDARTLEKEIAVQIPRVEEFRFIRQEAKKLGIRVWLFGGTAASFAHYVKWDWQRRNGDVGFQPERTREFQNDRFDYDYTNIYRSTQDLDLVVNGSAEAAAKLQQTLSERFPHLQGSKSAWEVRCLSEAWGEKESLLGNPDFLNQHTDSNSTGMVEITSSDEPIVRDLRDWRSRVPVFLEDVRLGKLHYYFSERHESTPRAKRGINPPIFSVIRYLTKVFQYELAVQPEDLEKIRRVIDAFDPTSVRDPYVQEWIEKNGKKLFQNAVNLEYAWNTLEKLGLRKKLIAIRNDSGTQFSLAWWMSKEPLRTYPLGRFEENDGRHRLIPGLRPWKTARERGIVVVAHDTRDLQAYESITRAHTGDPNVFISRDRMTGEVAAYGNAFYTRKGREGAVGTGITIRFMVHPDAVEGVDFTTVGDYVLVLNKAALTVIPESLSLGPLEYLKRVRDGLVFGAGDKAIIEKLKRRVRNRWRTLPKEETEKVADELRRELDEKKASATWAFVYEAMGLFGETLPEDIIERVVEMPAIHETLIRDILVRPAWIGKERAIPFLARIIKTGTPNAVNLLIGQVLGAPAWRDDPRAFPLLEAVVARGDYTCTENLLGEVLSRPYWAKDLRGMELLLRVVRDSRHSMAIINYFFSKAQWKEHPRALELLRAFLEHGEDAAIKSLVSDHLGREPWKSLSERKEIQELLSECFLDEKILEDRVPPELWQTPRGPEILSKLITKPRNYHLLNERVVDVRLADFLSSAYWAAHPRGLELVKKLVTKVRNFRQNDPAQDIHLITSILMKPEWYQRPGIEEVFSFLIDKRYDYYWLRTQVLHALGGALANDHWATRPEGTTLAEKLFATGEADNAMVRTILTQKAWAEAPGGMVLIKKLLAKRYSPTRDPRGKGYINNINELCNLMVHAPWAGRDDAVDVILELIDDAYAMSTGMGAIPAGLDTLMKGVFLGEAWFRHPRLAEMVRAMMRIGDVNYRLAREIFSDERWATHPEAGDLLAELIENRRADGDIVWHVLPAEGWARHPRAAEMVERLIKLGTVDMHIDRLLASYPLWRDHAQLRAACGGGYLSVKCLREAFARGVTFIAKAAGCPAALVALAQ